MINVSKKNLEIIIINIPVALGMCLAYMLFSSFSLPDGVNSTFMTRGWKVILIPFSVSVFFFFLKKKRLLIKKPTEKFDIKDIFLILFPMTPIIQYLLLNNNILDIMNSIIIVFFCITIIFIFSYILPWFLSLIAAVEMKILMLVSLGMVFFLFNMSSLSSTFAWHLSGSMLIQFLFLFAVILLLLFIYYSGKTFLYVLDRSRNPRPLDVVMWGRLSRPRMGLAEGPLTAISNLEL